MQLHYVNFDSLCLFLAAMNKKALLHINVLRWAGLSKNVSQEKERRACSEDVA